MLFQIFKGEDRPLFWILGDFLIAVEVEGCFEESLGVGMLRVIEDLLDGAGFDDFPLIHDGDVGAIFCHHGEVMGNQQQAHIPFGAEAGQFLENFVGDGDIKAGGGFIGDDEFWI